jgi:hypothetical protein
VLDTSLIDEIIQVTNDESIAPPASCRWKKACLSASLRRGRLCRAQGCRAA